MVRLILFLAAMALAAPAAAHALRVFARAEGDGVAGYGFFVGGGRPSGAGWAATMGGRPVASGRTGGDGSFAFALPGEVTGTVSVTLDAGDGHVATATLPPERFPAAPPPAAAQASSPDSPEDTARLVEAAVTRQVAPLLERIERMDARLRLTDALSGVFLILGLAGAALWARGRR